MKSRVEALRDRELVHRLEHGLADLPRDRLEAHAHERHVFVLGHEHCDVAEVRLAACVRLQVLDRGLVRDDAVREIAARLAAHACRRRDRVHAGRCRTPAGAHTWCAQHAEDVPESLPREVLSANGSASA